MTKFIEVNAVAGVEQPNNVVPFGGVAAVNGQDDLERDEQPVAEPTAPREIFLPTRINVETIRSYNVRKNDSRTGQPRIGTRIVFINGTALPVGNTIEEIDTKIAATS